MKRWLAVLAVVLIVGMMSTIAAQADPSLYECPDTHAHVWNPDQCESLVPGRPLGGGGGRCGIVCGIRHILGGLL